LLCIALIALDSKLSRICVGPEMLCWQFRTHIRQRQAQPFTGNDSMLIL
jgi:hypothetical protein